MNAAFRGREERTTMERAGYCLKRILQMIPVLLIVTILIFAMIRMIPGGDAAQVMLGDKATPEALAALRSKLGLDQPVTTQYWLFLKGVLKGDFGDSVQYRMPVSALLASRFSVTLLLTLTSALLTVLISFPLGYLAAVKKDHLADITIRGYSLLSISLPSFWIALLLMLAFGVKLKIFPVSGWGTTWAQHAQSLFLPALTQAVATSGILIRNLRNNVIDVKNKDYVDFAKSKGIRPSAVAARHVLRNALIPTTTLLSLKVAGMLGGSVIIESVFTLPGMGALLVDAVLRRDYAVVQGVVLIFSLTVLIINLLTDLLYSWLDPRVALN